MRAKARTQVEAPERCPGLAESARAASPFRRLPGRRPMPRSTPLQQALAQARGRLDGDPYANPIALLALDLEQKLGSGELDEHAAEALIQRLTREAFAARAAAARRYLGELDPARNARASVSCCWPAGTDADGAPLPFAAFAAGGCERVYYGFVFTAHPTFGRTMELQTMLAAAAFGPDGDPQREQILAACRAPDPPPAGAARPRRGARPVAAGHPHRSAPIVRRGLRDRLRRRARALSRRLARAAAAPAHAGDLGRLRHRRPRRHRLDDRPSPSG